MFRTIHTDQSISVGKHYVPQEYLRGFSSSNVRLHIWMFDKQFRQWSNPAISQVAQQRDYYPPEIEAELSRDIETPGHVVLKILRAGSSPQASQWADLILYVAVMLMRVPRKRRKGWEAVPQVLESTMARYRKEVGELLRPGNEDRVIGALQLLDRLEAEYAVSPPDTVQEQISSPWPSEKIAEAVGSMAWRLVSVPQPRYLITSDNPAYFFESLGLGRADSELTFPLAPNLALMGSRQGSPGTIVEVTAKPILIKEINRRLASGAERFVFSHRRAPWIETIALNRNPTLNRVRW